MGWVGSGSYRIEASIMLMLVGSNSRRISRVDFPSAERRKDIGVGRIGKDYRQRQMGRPGRSRQRGDGYGYEYVYVYGEDQTSRLVYIREARASRGSSIAATSDLSEREKARGGIFGLVCCYRCCCCCYSCC